MLTPDDLLADPIARYPAATVACFDPTRGDLPRRQLDEARTIDFLEKLSAAGAPAVLIGASTGHGHLRSTDELAQWLRCAARARLGSTIRMALLRPEDGVEANRALIALAASLEYPVIFVRPGRDVPKSAADTHVAQNLQPVVAEIAAAGLAVGLYSIPDVSGVRMSARAAEQVLNGRGGDRVVAIKVTEADYDTSTQDFLQHPALRHLKIVQGWDPHLARALQEGPRSDAEGRQRCGVTSGPMSFAIFQYLHLLTAADRGDWGEVEQAQAAVNQLFRAMQDDPQKFADLQRAKFLMGLGQPLLSTVTESQTDRVLEALRTVPRPEDRQRLARSLDLMHDGPWHESFVAWSSV